MKATDGKYVIIHDWMNSKELDLSAIEKLALGLVYGYCLTEEGCYRAKNAQLQEWLNCTKKTAIGTMNSLEEKGLIEKTQEIIGGKITNIYKIGVQKLHSMGVKITPVGCKNYTGGVQKLHPLGAKITPNKDINKDNIISLSQDARTREIETLKKWLRENAPGTESIVRRNEIAIKDISIENLIEALNPYIERYYTEQLEFGKGNLGQRGRSDVLQHFAIRIQTYIAQEQKEKEQKNTIKQPLKPKANELTREEFLAALD